MKALSSLALLILIYGSTFGQTGTTKTTTPASKSKATSTKAKQPVKKVSPPASGKELTLTLKSLCEKDLPIFSGPRADIAKPQVKIIGGLSKNTIYVKVNEVVCIMNDKKKPVACADVKPATTTIEVNISGTGITAK